MRCGVGNGGFFGGAAGQALLVFVLFVACCNLYHSFAIKLNVKFVTQSFI